MGGDGGTIINRRDCLRFNKGKKGKDISKDMERTTKWLHCSLSQEPLNKPIVGCRLGRLYNKDKILEFLLDKHSRGKFVFRIFRPTFCKYFRDIDLFMHFLLGDFSSGGFFICRTSNFVFRNGVNWLTAGH